jgi:hypothetical protein
MYPHLLDVEGQRIRRRMIHALRRFLAVALGGVVVTICHEVAKIIAPLGG